MNYIVQAVFPFSKAIVLVKTLALFTTKCLVKLFDYKFMAFFFPLLLTMHKHFELLTTDFFSLSIDCRKYGAVYKLGRWCRKIKF